MENNKTKLEVWSADEAKSVLNERFEEAKKDRVRFEGEWQSNESAVFDVGEEGGAIRYGGRSTFANDDEDVGASDEKDADFMAINIISRNIQLLHSQLCSNPPVVLGIPNSNEERDKDAAKSAEHVLAYSRVKFKTVDHSARTTMNSFVYGTGFLKNIFDGSKGAIIERTDEYVVTEGDNCYSVPRVWDMYLDPNATVWEEVEWLFEGLYMPVSKAIRKFGNKHKDKIKAAAIKDTDSEPDSTESLLYNSKSGVVRVLEYWETGLPCNGYKGRHCYCLPNGTLLSEVRDSPCSFQDSDGIKVARLPYSCLTYIDIPNTAWGRSPTAYTSRMQEMLNSCISVTISNGQNLGTPQLLVPSGSMDDEAKTNFSGNIAEFNVQEGMTPITIQASNVSNDIHMLIAKLEQLINDGWGVNDSMFGKQQRETSGITMQLSTMQGNLIRQRYFDKYVLYSQDFNELQLQYSQDNWKFKRLISVVGENNTVEAKALEGADLNGGYSIKLEYGQSFALDPITRGEQILKFAPFFQQGGIDVREMIKTLRLTDMRSIYDDFKLADDRAKEIIEAIKASGKQQPILSKYQDHIGVFAYMKKFTMDKAFETLDEQARQLINEHMEMRKQAHIENTASAVGMQGPQGAPAPQGMQQPQ